MIDLHAAFAPHYARARVLFLEAAAQAGMAIRSHNHPLKGLQGETLAMDVALDGPSDAQSLLILSSGCHGAEGFCGSGVQVNAMHNDNWRRQAREAGVAVLYVHALNPYGFSFLRRVTHENVDLNRNFQDFSQPLPVNPAYAELHDWLLPPDWPPSERVEASLMRWREHNGPQTYQQAVSQGQYVFAEGMFFGGQQPSWSNQTLRSVLRTHGATARQLAWVDVHTGLGPSGFGERIFAGRDNPHELARARAWWGGADGSAITTFYDGSSSSSPLTGLMWGAAYQECPQADYTGIALEYGTVPFEQVLQTLRADHWMHRYGTATTAQQNEIRAAMRQAFYVDSDAWREQVVAQSQEVLLQAVQGLCGQR